MVNNIEINIMKIEDSFLSAVDIAVSSHVKEVNIGIRPKTIEKII